MAYKVKFELMRNDITTTETCMYKALTVNDLNFQVSVAKEAMEKKGYAVVVLSVDKSSEET